MTPLSYGPLLDALRGVRWPARRAVGAALPGAHRSRQRGTSGEFTEYRLYRQGDDPRQIDWKLLARSDRTFVRLTDDRALVPTWLVVDGSGSMDYPRTGDADGAGVRSKWHVAKELAVGLAAVAHASADPVGMTGSGADGVVQFAPRSRQGTVNELSRVLDSMMPDGNRSLAPLMARIPSSARIVIITDLLGDATELLQASAHRQAAGGMVECVHVVAAEEIDLPRGAYLASDPDAPTVRRAMDAQGVRTYQERFAVFRSGMARDWRAIGAGYFEVRTNGPVARAIREIAAGASRGALTTPTAP